MLAPSRSSAGCSPPGTVRQQPSPDRPLCTRSGCRVREPLPLRSQRESHDISCRHFKSVRNALIAVLGVGGPPVTSRCSPKVHSASASTAVEFGPHRKDRMPDPTPPRSTRTVWGQALPWKRSPTRRSRAACCAESSSRTARPSACRHGRSRCCCVSECPCHAVDVSCSMAGDASHQSPESAFGSRRPADHEALLRNEGSGAVTSPQPHHRTAQSGTPTMRSNWWSANVRKVACIPWLVFCACICPSGSATLAVTSQQGVSCWAAGSAQGKPRRGSLGQACSSRDRASSRWRSRKFPAVGTTDGAVPTGRQAWPARGGMFWLRWNTFRGS